MCFANYFCSLFLAPLFSFIKHRAHFQSSFGSKILERTKCGYMVENKIEKRGKIFCWRAKVVEKKWQPPSKKFDPP
jgi:hypothetical protein